MRALLTGTFDPPTLGHLDIIQRSLKLFDELFVGIAINPAKKPLIPLEKRKKLLQSLTQAKVVTIDGLVVDFAKKNKIDLLIRGLRSFADLDRELQMAQMNRELNGIETLLLPGNPEFAHISSSLVRELAHHGARLEKLVPQEVIRIL
jgi:pantetheine-phosphate adenylyltransferase